MMLPRMAHVEQRLYARRIEDVPAAVTHAASPQLTKRLRRGDAVAVTVGSRGIQNIVQITSSVVALVRGLGGRPFILPAMGSHGGATARGQTALLRSLGVTPESVGAPIRASMSVKRLGKTSGGVVVYASAEALRADGVIVINRVKQHTDFVGEYESGLVKMLAIGLGKQAGAAAMHSQGCTSLRHAVPEAARIVLEKVPVIAGIAVLENGYHQTADLVGMAPEEIFSRERRLLRQVRRNAARLPFRKIDLLIVDQIGKDISGVGFDTRVIARRMIWEEPEFQGPRIHLIAALDLTPGSHGNPLGIGLADLTTDRLVSKIDWEALRANVLHTGWLNRAKLPLSFANDRQLLRAALTALGQPDPRRVRIVRIRDTLHLDRMWVSEAMLPEVRRSSRLRTLGEVRAVTFDRRGNLRWRE